MLDAQLAGYIETFLDRLLDLSVSLDRIAKNLEASADDLNRFGFANVAEAIHSVASTISEHTDRTEYVDS